LSRRARLGAGLGACVLALALGARAAEPAARSGAGDAARQSEQETVAPQQAAVPSALAARSLLLAVARAGECFVAVGEWGHVVRSCDGGSSWRQAAHVPTRRTLTAVAFVGARQGWAVGHDALVLHTRDGGERWEIQHWAPEEEVPLLSVWFEDERHGIAVGGFGLLVETRDGGRSWERRRLGAEDEEPHLNHVFAAPGDSLFIAAETGLVFRSRDAGSSWQRLALPYPGSLWHGLATDDAGALLLLGMRGHAFRSEDGGESWQAVETRTDQSLQSAVRLRDGRIVAVGLGGVVLTSSDGGRSFQLATRPDRRGIAAVAEAPDGSWLLFGESGATRLPGSAAE
jgi:photosystem II stability/assembly factor-like uncharacterized protein